MTVGCSGYDRQLEPSSGYDRQLKKNFTYNLLIYIIIYIVNNLLFFSFFILKRILLNTNVK